MRPIAVVGPTASGKSAPGKPASDSASGAGGRLRVFDRAVIGGRRLFVGLSSSRAATCGAGTWLVGQPHTVHLGASSLIFGWLTFLVARGVFTRRMIDIVIGIVVFLVYGTLLWGVLPNDPYVSWEGHLFGAIGGVVAAWAVSARKPAVPPRPAPVQFP